MRAGGGRRQIHEKQPLRVKNYGIALRYDSRGGTHNMYKEFRDLTLAGAVSGLFVWPGCRCRRCCLADARLIARRASPDRDMAARHSVRARSIQIIHTAVVAPKDTRRHNVQQFHNSKIRFPLPHRVIKSKSKYLASRPHTVL